MYARVGWDLCYLVVNEQYLCWNDKVVMLYDSCLFYEMVMEDEERKEERKRTECGIRIK
jgi:hypothetical protein